MGIVGATLAVARPKPIEKLIFCRMDAGGRPRGSSLRRGIHTPKELIFDEREDIVSSQLLSTCEEGEFN